MTDQLHDDAVDESTEQQPGINRRRMFLAGAGLAGAAALTKVGTASAADGANVVVGGEYDADTATSFNNTSVAATDPGTTGAEALVGTIGGAANGSHAVRGSTNGVGHAVAGTVPAGNTDNSVAATWGKHDNGQGAGVGGVNGAEDVDIAGPARGVEGIVLMTSNGSHAVYGETRGGGHSVAGDTPAEFEDPTNPGTMIPVENTVAATWGRHMGAGAGIGGVSVNGYGGEFVGGRASVRLIPSEGVAGGAPDATGGMVGELVVDGNGDLYYNDGTLFTKLNGQAGGTVILNDIQRAYDSREEFPIPASQKGRHAADEVREIDLTEFSDMPASASGAIINLTVADTDALGYALVYNGDTDAKPTDSTGSSINWVDAGEFVANGITVAVSATGTVNVYTLVGTDVIIDVIGYIS